MVSSCFVLLSCALQKHRLVWKGECPPGNSAAHKGQARARCLCRGSCTPHQLSILKNHESSCPPAGPGLGPRYSTSHTGHPPQGPESCVYHRGRMPLFSGPPSPQLQNGCEVAERTQEALRAPPAPDGEETAYMGLAIGAIYPSGLFIYPGEESWIGTTAMRTGYRGKSTPPPAVVSLQGCRPSSCLLWALDSWL